MARARKKAKRARPRKRRVLDLATSTPAQRRGIRHQPLRQGGPTYWSASGSRTRNPEDHDFAIIVGEDEKGWHYWVMDQRTASQVATSTKAYPSQQGALNAAQRAGRRHLAAKEAARAPKGAPVKKGRGRLPSVLNRI
jgi:hypothetical protein